ncbi:hypothetical protein [Wolbachia endosymbiont of Ctenocephalides felis wCfeT]|uniref:hypothetical protein n=1 Tax=Wolbachia endosymbiont of Ctenocephalides felis wCfeT TaxID=2732593 RepID=UPI001446DDAD|nr:hypothetical protein [Wolbachia endosymbiont of Ctenocephalides felis wCfeT]
MKKANDCDTSALYNNDKVKALLSEAFFELNFPKEIKIHKQSKNLSLKEFIVGLCLVCASLSCEKLYRISNISDLNKSYVPNMVLYTGAFVAFFSSLWCIWDKISLRILKTSLNYWLSDSTIQREIDGSMTQTPSTSRVACSEAYCHM